ncbi:MAG: DUF4363 family protein [Clostridia bacterium]|nr:DUF4363 family protein [Clostridia bacterium]
MKRVVIALVMLIFAVSITSWSAHILDNKIDSLINLISRTTSEDSIDELIAEWESVKKFLKIITVHNTVDEIDIKFTALKGIINDKNEADKTRSELIFLLKLLAKSEKAAFENIF